jgi:N-acetyl-gamma-glutamyl-phosphate reductase
VEIVAATTTSSEGTPVASVHRDLIGETDLCFGKELNDPDVIFLCLGHGISRQFVDTHDIKPECRIIDLGNDFRLDGNYAGRNFIYGLCESAREDVRTAHDVANPGCFATAIQLATLPLAAAGLISDEIHVTAITGSTGAGKKPGETTHFSYRSDNISIYKLFTHQHLAEIKQNLVRVELQNQAPVDSPELADTLRAETPAPVVNFVPLRGDFARGIFASVYTRAAEGMSEADYRKIFEDYYAESPFVFHSNEGISMKEVVNTNKGLVHVELHDGYVHIASCIDNLVKGAAGQAVQNMNLMFGLPEDTGLRLKPSAF